jgi:hypothetical protein
MLRVRHAAHVDLAVVGERERERCGLHKDGPTRTTGIDSGDRNRKVEGTLYQTSDKTGKKKADLAIRWHLYYGPPKQEERS